MIINTAKSLMTLIIYFYSYLVNDILQNVSIFKALVANVINEYFTKKEVFYYYDRISSLD